MPFFFGFQTGYINLQFSG